ncbi:FAD:protein FMN transferase [Congregibacter sp.]|uniref:FAD:protein FMN transferase n=1 Tax=Congregibacter sp. TaxID=2744308 RepID=UPI003F6B06EC
MHHNFRIAITALLAVFLLSSCADRPSRVVLKGGTMGTTWSVIYSEPEQDGPGVSAEELQTLIETELLAINQTLSTYIPESEISLLNSSPDESSVLLSSRFSTVLDAALSVGGLTDGAYDVTVRPLVELWGFGARTREPVPPTEAQIQAAMVFVGAHRLSWNAEASTLSRPAGVEVDLSSIAKGYAVDQLSDMLAARGVVDSLVEIGGELRARGQRPEGGLWRLAVESPDPSQSRFIEALAVSDAAVATSGDYRNYFEYEGRRYSHLVDPRSGYPVAHELVSVTVVHRECMTADALATALLVLGLDAALQLAKSQGIAAHFVARGEEALEVHYTPAFEAYRQNTQAGESP